MAESLSDATLLERFVTDREEAAFAALVRRHGPRVERICRRILRNEHDVEDVFQGTFLTLARKAGAIPWHESVSPWLDGVARRLAMHARSGAARHRGREVAVETLAGSAGRDARLPERFHPMVEPSAEVERRDLRRVLDDELLRLPEKYRAPVVLCDLEGHTREEAARRLGWPTGSMSRRLDRARSLLRQRLTHRGVALGLIGLMASVAIAAACVGLNPDPGRPDSVVHRAMATFPSHPGNRDGYEGILAATARSRGTALDFARILPAARAAAAAARQLEGHDPGRSSALWRQFVLEMRESATGLERACEQADAGAVVLAARRLDASCVRCHSAFRRDSAPSDSPGADRSASRPRVVDPPEVMGTPRLDPVLAGTAGRPGTAIGRRFPGDPAPSDTGLRLPSSGEPSAPLLFASNECMSNTVKTDGPDRWGLIAGCGSSAGVPRAAEASQDRLDARVSRAGWGGMTAC